MEWGVVTALEQEGVRVELAGGERKKPMPAPRGVDLQPGDRVLVAKVGGRYLVLAGYGGENNGE